MRIAGPPTSISVRPWTSERRRWESERRKCGKPSLQSARRDANGNRRRVHGYFRRANGICRASNPFRRGSDGHGRALDGCRALKKIFFLWRPSLPDPEDDMVLERAVASQAQYIVTYNGKDTARPSIGPCKRSRRSAGSMGSMGRAGSGETGQGDIGEPRRAGGRRCAGSPELPERHAVPGSAGILPAHAPKSLKGRAFGPISSKPARRQRSQEKKPTRRAVPGRPGVYSIEIASSSFSNPIPASATFLRNAATSSANSLLKSARP
jgi:hypothetical protein